MRKILIINRLGIGDVVVTTPLAEAIKREDPSAVIGFLVSPKAVDIITNHPFIDDVFAYRVPSVAGMLQQIRSKNYNEAVIVDERFTSTILAMRAGCKPIKPGFEISVGKKRLFIRKELAENAIRDYTSYIRYLYKVTDVPELLPAVGDITKASLAKVQEWLEQYGFDNRNLIMIAPRGLTDNKNWPPEYFGELNQYLNNRGFTPVYLGSQYDFQYIEDIDGEKINIAGLFSLREVAAIAKHALFCISVCTGVMHVMAAQNVPIVALYGPTSVRRWAPPQAYVVKAEVSCSPCALLCTNSVYKLCMKRITPQRIIDLIEDHGWVGGF